MKNVRITAIRQIVYRDLMAKYENPIEHTCSIKEGQSWIAINGQCPEGLCSSAWDTMRPFVESLARGNGNFFDGWMKNPMSALISCNDGFRPFSFYLEVIEELQPSLAAPQRPANKGDLRVQRLVRTLGNVSMPRRELMDRLGLKQGSRRVFIYNYFKPAVELGYVKLLMGHIPNVPEQAYRLTKKGIDFFNELSAKD